jgi:two-component system chemotaxis response regulator CheY
LEETDKKTALIADDERHIRLLLKTVLNTINIRTLGEAENGQKAVEMFRELKPDIVLLDINMPVMGGEEALEAIMKEFPGTVAIMLTSVADSESIHKCIGLGASNYIRKDTPIEEIKTIIAETIREC